MPIRYLGGDVLKVRYLGGDVEDVFYPLAGVASISDGGNDALIQTANQAPDSIAVSFVTGSADVDEGTTVTLRATITDPDHDNTNTFTYSWATDPSFAVGVIEDTYPQVGYVNDHITHAVTPTGDSQQVTYYCRATDPDSASIDSTGQTVTIHNLYNGAVNLAAAPNLTITDRSTFVYVNQRFGATVNHTADIEPASGRLFSDGTTTKLQDVLRTATVPSGGGAVEVDYSNITTIAATFLTGHTVSLSSLGSYSQTVTGTVGATYTTNVVSGVQTIPSSGSNVHIGSTSAVAACSGNSITTTIAASGFTQVSTAPTSASDSNSQTGPTGTSSSSTVGRITSGGVYPTSCTPASSAADPSNPCSPTTTTTCSSPQFQNYRNRIINNCDGSWTGSYASAYAVATGTSVTGTNTSATNTSYVPGTYNDDSAPFNTNVQVTGTCMPTDTSVGCCPDTTCTGQPGTQATSFDTAVTRQVRRNCDDGAVGSPFTHVTSTGNVGSQSCSDASYPNPDTCVCTGNAVSTPGVRTSQTIFGTTTHTCSYTVTPANGAVNVGTGSPGLSAGTFIGAFQTSLAVSHGSSFPVHQYFYPATAFQVCAGNGVSIDNDPFPSSGCGTPTSFSIS